MASPVLDDLIETFIEDLNDKQRQNVIDKLKRENSEAAELLRSVWRMEKNARSVEGIADKIGDLV